MTLDAIRHVLEPTGDLDLLAERHVDFDDFGAGHPVEAAVVDAFDADRPRIVLVGDPGTGKSSLASASVGRSSQQRDEMLPTPRLFPIPSASVRSAQSPVEAAQAVLEALVSHLNQARQIKELSDEVISLPGKRGLTAKLGLEGVASIAGTAEAASTELHGSPTALDVRQAIDTVLGDLVDKGVMAVLFFDDADKILRDIDGTPDETALRQLFGLLDDLSTTEGAIVVSLQRDYMDFEGVQTYAGEATATVSLPALDETVGFLGAVLDRALAPHDRACADVFEEMALGALVGTYAASAENMRRTLKAADEAVSTAIAAGVPSVSADFVARAVRNRPA